VHNIDDVEEEREEHVKGNDADKTSPRLRGKEKTNGTRGTTQKPVLHKGEKRKELDLREKGKQVDTRTKPPHCKKRKMIKETYVQALTEDEFERIGDRVKEVTDRAFQCATLQ